MILIALLSQGCSVKARIKKADKRYEIGEYHAAGELYKKAYSGVATSDKQLKAKVAFRQGECFRLINNPRAEQAYQNAIRYNYSDSIVYLRYAQVLHRSGKYGDAMKNYSIYMENNRQSVVAKNGIIACRQVAGWTTGPGSYTVAKPDLFNVRNADSFSPAFLTPEADVLIFTSSRQYNKKTVMKNNTITGQPNNNMYMTRKDAVGKWEKPTILDAEVNAPEEDGGVATFSPDGKIMFFTRSRQLPGQESGTEIYSSNRAGGTWSTPQKIKVFADSTISVGHPALAPDGQTFYFVSDAKNGLGGKDIWKATLENGECKYIENLGPEINTDGDEMFPSVRADGTLFFASNGLPGFGGLDIFKATFNKESGWKVENLGAPVNSPADEFGITFAGKSEKGYFSSTRNDRKGYASVWSFEMPEYAYLLEGKVTDEKGTVIPEATIRLVTSTGINSRVQSKKDGTYRLKLDKDMECVMMASARGYLNKAEKLSTLGLTQSKTFTVNFQLASVSKPIEIENIFYEFGKWDLTPASESGLSALVKVLTDNPNITIEISANTDFVGSAAGNKVLSERRAKSVVDYLISKGIASDRLTSVGNGKEKPVVVDASLARKHPFLPENTVLDETFILTLAPNQQEIANQVNRRTEFRVVKTTYKLY